MVTYSEEQALLKNIEQVAYGFIYQINKAFNKDKDYYSNCTWQIKNVGFNTKTFVMYDEYFRVLSVTLDVNDVLQYVEKNEISLESATKLLLSHEIFHILLGHFSSKYKNHNKEILNIAGDLEINQLIGLYSPGIRPEDLMVKPYRNTDYYYDILMKEVESQKKNIESMIMQIDSSEENSDPDETEQFGSEELEDCEETSQSDQETAESNGEASSNTTTESGRGTQSIEERIIEDLLPEDVMINRETVERMSSDTIEINENIKNIHRIEETIKKSLSKQDTYNIKGLSEIVRKMVNREKAVKITPHDKVSSYYKFNNRKKSDFILPGKKLTNSGTRKKLDSSLTVFIDVSGSTRGKININLMNVARKMHELGATIVYYRGSIVSICEPDKAFFTEYGAGGTDITTTITQYLRNGYELHRAYVFTDGQDDFRYLQNVCDRFTIYFIDRGRVYERYTEKSEIRGRW